MEITSFDESNHVLSKPSDMSHEECTAASVLITKINGETPVVVSCWKLTYEELSEITKTGRIWLTIAGYTMSPVIVSGIKPEYVMKG